MAIEELLPFAIGDLVGPQGPQGETGQQGPQGPQGESGRDGKDGVDGKDGEIPKELARSIEGLSKTAVASLEKLAKLNDKQWKELVDVLKNKQPPPVVARYEITRDEQGLTKVITPIYKSTNSIFEGKD